MSNSSEIRIIKIGGCIESKLVDNVDHYGRASNYAGRNGETLHLFRR